MEKVHLLHHGQITPLTPLRNRRGVTVTELLVVLGMIGIVALGNATFIYDFVSALKKQTARSEGESDLSTLNIAAVNILKKSASSFNKLELKDDNGKNFFDYYPDVPFSILQKNSNADRIFTLKAGTANQYFYLMQTEEGDFDSLIFDPMFAYKNTGDSPDLMSNGSVQYIGLNSIANITGIAGGPNAGTMTKVFQTRWTDGMLFLLSCPTYLRPLTTAGGIDILTPPRFASYLGSVAGSDLLPVSTALTGVTLKNSHPVSNVNYSGVDNFMRTLPSVGGAAPFVKIEPVNLVRFAIRLNAKTGKNDFIFQELKQGKYQDRTVLLSDVDSIKFVRKSITLPIISMEVLR
ncbi:type II secretion system protein [Bdellovibrio sp. HCB209]|uniref:type II secretion system protein n=1 Tax=Bdellovibrio sp. HCB209 TaxID=3394354 RepID=UPI0039B55A97